MHLYNVVLFNFEGLKYTLEISKYLPIKYETYKIRCNKCTGLVRCESNLIFYCISHRRSFNQADT
jgi:hypothetical protein